METLLRAGIAGLAAAVIALAIISIGRINGIAAPGLFAEAFGYLVTVAALALAIAWARR